MGGGLLTRIRKIRQFLRENPHSLMVTYNWGSVEWMIANRFFPLLNAIHVQDGYGQEESGHEIFKRTLIRRFAYAPTPVIVPSKTLLHRINTVWKTPQAHQHYIPNGIDLMRFNGQSPLSRADFNIPETAIVIGTIAGLRAEKNIGRLITAFHTALKTAPNLYLLILGEGAEEKQLKSQVDQLGLSAQVTFAGNQNRPEDFIPLMDIFALSSDTEQMPLTVIEAMACSKPVAAPDIGDIKTMVSTKNTPYIQGTDAEALSKSLQTLAASTELRHGTGRKNQQKAQSHYSDIAMYQAWAKLYEKTSVQGRIP